MDTNKIMIGDKVLVKVLSQIPDTFVVHTWTAEDYMRDLLQVKPIPLTAEILEKNGFDTIEEISIYHEDGTIGDGMWQNDELYCGYDNTEGNFEFYTFSHDPEEEGIQQTIQKILYVHELQMALRLCGLSDVADNFKVE